MTKDTGTTTTAAATEATEKIKQRKTQFRLDDAQRNIITGLIEIQKTMKKADGAVIPDDEFSERYLKMSGSAWNLMKTALKPEGDGGYFAMVKKPLPILTRLSNCLRNLKRHRATGKTGSKPFHLFDDFAATIRALEEAKERDDANRLVFFLAPTGGGKSELCKHIASEDGYVVEARKAWFKSYFTALRDIANGLGVNHADIWSPADLEDAIAAKANTINRGVLAIDEGRFFGPDTLDLLIWLLNNTTLTILICTPPEYYERWVKKFPNEARQVVRRTHEVIQAQIINADDAQKILEPCGLNGLLRTAAVMARDGANQFGRFDFLHRLAEKLNESPISSQADIKAAIDRVLADMHADVLLSPDPKR